MSMELKEKVKLPFWASLLDLSVHSSRLLGSALSAYMSAQITNTHV